MYSGLADPVLDSQRVFRAVMNAMAHPGRVSTVPAVARVPEPLSIATAAVALTLLDFETPLWLDGAANEATVRDYLRFHSGCPVVIKPERARFALIADAQAIGDWAVFDVGTDEYPDRSATLSQGPARHPVVGLRALDHAPCRVPPPPAARMEPARRHRHDHGVSRSPDRLRGPR